MQKETAAAVGFRDGEVGGRELNFSSDIDLILLIQKMGLQGGRKELDNAQFFTRLGQN